MAVLVAPVSIEPPSSQEPAKSNCADSVHAGESRIRPILDGCVLQKMWSGAGSSAGTSFNTGESVRPQWRIPTDGGKTWTTSFDGLYRKK